MGIEVLGILLILGLPTYFFWRKVYAKRIVGDGNRKVAIWLSTICVTPIIYVAMVGAFFYCLTYYPNDDFDKNRWKADRESRYKMSKNIIESGLLIGKTQKEVITLLGDEGNDANSEHWVYYLGFVPEIANIDPDILEVTFRNGKVAKVSQRNT